MDFSRLVSADWRSYLNAVREHADKRIFLGFIAILIIGLMEGGGLMVLLPMLQTVGIESGHQSGSPSGLINKIQEYGSQVPLVGLLGIFLSLIIGQTLAKTVLNRILTRLQVDFTYFLRDRLHHALTGADWSVFLQLRGSDVIRAFTNEVNLAAMGLLNLTSLGSSVILAAVQIGAAFLIAPTVTIAAVIVGTVIVVLLLPLARRVREESLAGQIDRGALAANITDHVGGLKLAKSHGAENRRAQSFQDISRAVGERQLRITIFQTRSQAVFRLVSAFTLCLVVWYAIAWEGIHGAELAIMAVIFMRLVGRMMAIQQIAQSMVHVFPAFQATEELRHKWLTASEDPAITDAAPLPLLHQIVIHEVTYRYPESKLAALQGISLAIKAGQTTAVCGPSGGGKSTLADLVLGLIPPTEGEINVDGIPLTGSAIHTWRRAVAYVPQDVFLLNDTIRENLLWLSPHSDEADLWTALEQAAITDLVRKLPLGLDTPVGDRGVRLSGGERQRLALARALLRKPTLLVLDEATSSLDNANERLINDAIDLLRGSMTIIIIAHRLSTIRHADQIAVINSGRIVQSGNWDELAADASGLFANMISVAEI